MNVVLTNMTCKIINHVKESNMIYFINEKDLMKAMYDSTMTEIFGNGI